MAKKIVVLNTAGHDTGSFFRQKDENLELIKYIKTDLNKNDEVLKKKRGRKKNPKLYFTQDTEDAIVRYNTEENVVKRHQIYEEHLKYPFEKMAENIINTFKFPYVSEKYMDIKTEVISKLLIEMPKYIQQNGKAFSYFSIIAKNHLIILNNEAYKELKLTHSLESEDENGHYQYDILDDAHDKEAQSQDTKEFIKLMVVYWENNITSIFKKKRDIDIAYAVVELFKNLNFLELFNKKALYLLIREMTGHKTQYITRVINKMTLYYDDIKNKYYTDGIIKEDDFF